MADAHDQNAPGSVQAVDFQQGFALECLTPLIESETHAPAVPPDLIQARSDIEAAARPDDSTALTSGKDSAGL